MRSDTHRRILWLLPHPDDEFACSMRIRATAAAGDEVHCVFLTDGGFGGQSVARRRLESLRVLRRLGVGAAAVHFLGERHGFRDGTLHERLEDALQALDALIEAMGAVDVLHVPAWEGGHQDHDATHLLGIVLARRRSVGSLRQFPLYHGAGLPGPWFRVLHPLAANGPVQPHRATPVERLWAVALCLSYRSQWRTWLGLLPFFAWHMLARGTFPEQQVDPARVAESPHVGVVLYQRRGFLAMPEFRRAADAFLAAHGIAPATVP